MVSYKALNTLEKDINYPIEWEIGLATQTMI